MRNGLFATLALAAVGGVLLLLWFLRDGGTPVLPGGDFAGTPSTAPAVLDEVTQTSQRAPHPSQAAGEPAGRTVFSISDCLGLPAEGSVGSIVTAGRLVETFTVGEDGIVEFAADDIAGTVIGIRHNGHALYTLRLPVDPLPLYQIALSKGVVVSGRVVMVDGMEPPAGARVFMWEEGAELSLGSSTSSYVEIGGRYSVKVGQAGEFQADDLREGARYGITVYGGGVVAIAANEPRSILAPSEGNLLTAHYLYGGRVVIDPGSPAIAALARESSMWAPTGYRGEGDILTVNGSPRHWLLGPHSWGVVLAGYELPEFPRSLFPRSMFVAMESGQLPSVAVELQSNLPCLGGRNLSFELSLVADGERLRDKVVLIDGKAFDAFGSIAFGLGYPGFRFDLPGLRRIPAQLRLEPVGANQCLDAGDVLCLNAAWERFSGSFVVECVPPGEYLARLALVEANTFFPPATEDGLPVRVEAGLRTQVSISSPELGTLHIDTSPGLSGKYTGAARVLLGQPSGKIGQSGNQTVTLINPDEYVFERPPYEMGPLPVGDYLVLCHVAGGIAEPPDDDSGVNFFPVRIERGENWIDVQVVPLSQR